MLEELNMPVRNPGSYITQHALAVPDQTGVAAPVSPANPLPTDRPRILPIAWANGAVTQDLRSHGEAELQVAGLSGGDTISVARSLDGNNFVSATWIDQGFATGMTIAANGTYSFAGGGFLRWSRIGNASAPILTLRGGN
jgi:hypothetical protein